MYTDMQLDTHACTHTHTHACTHAHTHTSNIHIHRHATRHTRASTQWHARTHAHTHVKQTWCMSSCSPLKWTGSKVPQFLSLLPSGPTPTTISDFWQMIWDHKPAVIVMLTRVQENAKVSTCTIHSKLSWIDSSFVGIYTRINVRV